jgi:hypothetical protein
MNKLKELEKKIEELSKELEELKLELDKEKMNKTKINTRWRANDGEKHYFIYSDGTIDWSKDTNDEISVKRYELSNYFQTEEEAEKTVEKIKIYTQLKDLALRLNHGREIDWRNYNQLKYSIYYDSFYKNIYTICTYYSKELGRICCLDKNFLDVAKREIGEKNLKKLFE